MSHNRTNKIPPGEKSNFTYEPHPGFSTILIQDSIVACTRNVAIVELNVAIGDVNFRVRGDSKRFLGDGKRPADKHDPALAVGLATQRALKQVLKRVERQTNGLMIHHEKQEASNKKKAKSKKTTKKGKE